MNPQHPELFPQRPIRSDFGRTPSYRARRIVTVVVVLLVLGGIIRWVYGGASLSHPGEIPTIKAEGAWKQRPEQPGGIDIPHQDVQVYQALDGNAAKPQVEHLLPPPEVPQAQATVQTPVAANSPANPAPPPPVSSAPQTENLMPSPAVATVAESAVPAPAPSPALAVAPVVTTTVETQPVKPVTAPPVAPVVNKKPVAVAQVSKASAPANKTGRVVQLASVQDETSARDMASKLQARYASILGDTQLRIVRADLGAKGIYYRIQSHPVPEDQASQICTAIKQLNAGCILVR